MDMTITIDANDSLISKTVVSLLNKKFKIQMPIIQWCKNGKCALPKRNKNTNEVQTSESNQTEPIDIDADDDDEVEIVDETVEDVVVDSTTTILPNAEVTQSSTTSTSTNQVTVTPTTSNRGNVQKSPLNVTQILYDTPICLMDTIEKINVNQTISFIYIDERKQNLCLSRMINNMKDLKIIVLFVNPKYESQSTIDDSFAMDIHKKYIVDNVISKTYIFKDHNCMFDLISDFIAVVINLFSITTNIFGPNEILKYFEDQTQVNLVPDQIHVNKYSYVDLYDFVLEKYNCYTKKNKQVSKDEEFTCELCQ